MTIKTSYDAKPVPDRQFDWSAIDTDTYEGGAPIGFGFTEQGAIEDLVEQLIEAGYWEVPA